MVAEFERLQDIGSFGLDCGVEFAVVRQTLGDGYSHRLTIGSTSGVPDWKLIYKTLPQTLDSPVTVGTDLQSRADYLWNFYCRHMARNSRSFIITDPRSGKDYLVGFAENRLTYQLFAVRLFSSGVALEYRREPGVATLDDGSLGTLENPNVI